MRLCFTIGLTASLVLTATAAIAEEGQHTFSSGYRFVEMSGEELYNNVCRACHMLDAKGRPVPGPIRRSPPTPIWNRRAIP